MGLLLGDLFSEAGPCDSVEAIVGIGVGADLRVDALTSASPA